MNNSEGKITSEIYPIEYKIWKILFKEYKAIKKDSKKSNIRIELNTFFLTISLINSTKQMPKIKENTHYFIRHIQEHFSLFGISSYITDGNLILTCSKKHIGNLLTAATNNTTYELNNGVLANILSRTRTKNK